MRLEYGTLDVLRRLVVGTRVNNQKIVIGIGLAAFVELDGDEDGVVVLRLEDLFAVALVGVVGLEDVLVGLGDALQAEGQGGQDGEEVGGAEEGRQEGGEGGKGAGGGVEGAGRREVDLQDEGGEAQ